MEVNKFMVIFFNDVDKKRKKNKRGFRLCSHVVKHIDSQSAGTGFNTGRGGKFLTEFTQ